MANFSVEQWVTLISAVTAAVVAIINALKGKTIETKLDQHAAAQAVRHEETMAALSVPPPSKGALP